MPSLSANMFSRLAMSSLSLSIKLACKLAKSCKEAFVSISSRSLPSYLFNKSSKASTLATSLSNSSRLTLSVGMTTGAPPLPAPAANYSPSFFISLRRLSTAWLSLSISACILPISNLVLASRALNFFSSSSTLRVKCYNAYLRSSI